VRDLREEYLSGKPQAWHEYCPNAAALNAIGAVQNCPRAALFLKTPRSW
jgi:hypothetical protein